VRARIGLLLLAVAASACNPLYYVGVKFVYKRADLPDRQILRNFSYDSSATPSPRERLDLFLPEGHAWPIVIFVHGGSWTEGERTLEIGGADMYENIGRFLAGRGIGAAVIDYRLIPEVDWRTQAADVDRALAWVYSTIPIYGGRRDAIFLMGHSAGAQLAMRAALDRAALGRVGVPPTAIAGVIAVSGAAYDLTDQKTYDLGNDPEFYAERFRIGPTDTGWQREASVVPLVSADAPPSLLMYAGGETTPLQRQSQVMATALKAAGATTTLLEIPGLSHTHIVPTLSRDDREAGAAVLAFVREHTPGN
jgi:acetyl esterase/lipase